MYRQLQEEAKKYIVVSLCKISDKWRFDIDTAVVDNPVVVMHEMGGSISRVPIEMLHVNVSREFLKKMAKMYYLQKERLFRWGGCIMIRHLLNSVFDIYGIKIECDRKSEPLRYKVIAHDDKWGINSYVLIIINQWKNIL